MIIKLESPVSRKVRTSSYGKHVEDILVCKEGECLKVEVGDMNRYERGRIRANVRKALENQGHRLISQTDAVGNFYFWRGAKIEREN